MKKPFFFNMAVLRKFDAFERLEVLENYYYKRLPKNKFSLRKFANLSGGSSFLINPKALFASRTDLAYKIQYLMLAARRDFLMYAEYGITCLDLSFYPDLDIDKLYCNPLLRIEENKLYFLYEN